MNLMEELAAHLEMAGLGTVPDARRDGDIHWGRMPEAPDECVCIFSTDSGTGGPDGPARFQIMNRAKTVKAAYEKSCAIADELDEFDGFLAGDGRKVIIEVMNAATGLGADAKKREIYVTNISVKYCD